MPANVVCMGAQCRCDQGAAPTPLTVTSQQLVNVKGALVATVMDHVPIMNIAPFGICQQLTKAAGGTPTPCVPATATKWAPGSKIEVINSNPILTKDSTLNCSIGGKITIVNPGCTMDRSTT